MLQVKNLWVTHKKDQRTMVEGLSFVLQEGDKAAVIGEEGDGKSTLMKLLYDPALVEDYVEYGGEIIKGGLKIGYLSQEIDPGTGEGSVYGFFGREEDFFLRNPKELSQIAGELGLDPGIFYSDQKMKDLSGGEKVKVRVAGLLVGEPDLLFLDEPTNDLDLETCRWMETWIAGSPLPILFISHDETLLERTANKIIHIEQLRRKSLPRCTVSATGYGEYLDRRLRGMAHQEMVARKERSDYRKQQERFRQIYEKVEHQQEVITRQNPGGARLLKKKIHALKSQERRFEKQAENRTEMPETEESIFFKLGEGITVPKGKVVLDYSLERLCVGERLLAENISLRVEGPEHICIIGENGAGKTTLLRKIAAALLDRRDIRVCYMPQNYEEGMELDRTPVSFLAVTGDREETARNRTYLGSMKYTPEEMSHPIRELSGGQKAKLFLLKMGILGSNVLILDEPTRNFSPLSQPVVRRILQNYGGAVISVSHDRKYIGEVCGRVYRLTPRGLVEDAL